MLSAASPETRSAGAFDNAIILYDTDTLALLEDEQHRQALPGNPEQV